MASRFSTRTRKDESAGPKRAALYPRVSDPYGDRKRANGAERPQETPLDQQETACRRYAADHGHAVLEAHVYREAHTGVELWERPQLTRLREAIRSREVDVLIVYSIDRLSRDPVHLGVIISEAEHAGVAVEFVTEPLDNSPEGQLIRFVRGYAAKVEHEKIKDRTMRGKKARAQAGKLLPGCRPRFGYRFTDDRSAYAEDPATAPVVRRLWQLAVRGTTVRAIAARLTGEGIRTPTGGAAWSHTTVRQVLSDPLYTGRAAAWRWAKDRETGHGTRTVRQRDPSEQIPLPEGTVPPLVSVADFEAVQARLRLNKLRASRNNRTPHETLLRGGYVRCGLCDYAMQVSRQVSGPGRALTIIYRCARRSQADGRGCTHNMQATILDGIAWARVKRVLGKRGVIKAELDRMRTADPTSDDLAAVERHLTTVARQQRNLIENLADVTGTAAALIAEKINTLEAQRAQLAGERQGILQRRAAEAAQARVDELEAWCATVAANVETLDYEGKRLALDALNVQVKLWPTGHEPRYEVTASVPLPGGATSPIVDTTS